MTPTISLVRATYALTDELVEQYVAAQQIQIDRDFGPAYGVSAKVVFVPPGAGVPRGSWPVLLLDTSDQADAMGYHDMSGPEGEPLSKVFVRDAIRGGMSWTVTCSHEVLEMLGDPNIEKTTQASGFEYAYEVCDCCEDDRFSYVINGVHVTDFALPAWFDLNAAPPYTFRQTVDAPFELAVGGYIGRRTLPDGEWEQHLARGLPGPRTVKGPFSRTKQRFGVKD